MTLPVTDTDSGANSQIVYAVQTVSKHFTFLYNEEFKLALLLLSS